MAFKMKGFSGPFKKPLVGDQHKLPENVKQGILDAPMKQQVFGGKKSVKLSKNPPSPKPSPLPPGPPPPQLDPKLMEMEEVKPIIRHYSNPETRTVNKLQDKKMQKKPMQRVTSFKQTAAGTEDASPGGGKPPELKKKSKTIEQRIKDLELHKQTNTKEYKELVAQVSKGYGQGNYDEVD